MIWRRLAQFFSQDVAMDLGTANTLLYTRRLGLVLNEPSVVAYDAIKRSVYAVGIEAKRYLGRAPKHIEVIRPLREGVIANFDMTHAMISYFVKKVLTYVRIRKPSFVICVPLGITQVEKKAVIDAALFAGACDVKLVEEPMAAAIGGNLRVHEPIGNMVLDIGGGTSEVAVISLDGIVRAQSMRVAGDAMDLAVQDYIHEVFRMKVGINTAEQVKIQLGSAVPQKETTTLNVSGKDVVQGVPRVISISDGQVREALSQIVRMIGESVLRVLESTPPELASDIFRSGILITGGGSLLRGLDAYIAQETKVNVMRDKEPLTTVLRGTAKAMLERESYRLVFIN